MERFLRGLRRGGGEEEDDLRGLGGVSLRFVLLYGR